MSICRSTIQQIQKNSVALLGIPYDANSSFMRGPAKAPEIILQALESDSANFFTENLLDLSENESFAWVGSYPSLEYLQLGNPIGEILKKEAIPFSLGGDHSISYPVISKVLEKYPGLNIIHFDAHGDLYDALDNNKYSHACPFARLMETGKVGKLIQVGLRTITQHQKEQAEKFGVVHFQMKDQIPSDLFKLEDPTYITFDMDVLDPAFAPGISHYEPGGMSTREAISLIQSINAPLVGADLVEFNPDRDINGITAMTAAKIVKEIADKLLSQ